MKCEVKDCETELVITEFNHICSQNMYVCEKHAEQYKQIYLLWVDNLQKFKEGKLFEC